jgi:hypothetical protein
MEDATKVLIHQKIDELKELAKDTESPFILFLKEKDEKNGRHVAAYGSGKEIVELIKYTAEHDAAIKKVLIIAVADL